MQHLEELASALRAHGLEVEVDGTKGTITVDTAPRGPKARSVLITMEPGDLEVSL